jgi:peptide chain release factor 1
MDKNIKSKIEHVLKEKDLLEKELFNLDIESDKNLFIEKSKKISYFDNILSIYKNYNDKKNEIEQLKTLINDIELRDIVTEEINKLTLFIKKQENDLIEIFSDKLESNKYNNIYLEIRAAAGGNESSFFAEDLFKMYINYSNINRWKTEIMSLTYGNYGGYKDIIIRIIGSNVFEKLKFESGVHRVQRIPQTESKGRVHTSTCSVAIIPESDTLCDTIINISDLRIDTYRSSGAGGQHVNVTDSAVRITHKPTGIVAECQDERSQHKNKNKALSLLKSRILLLEKNKQKIEIDNYRKNLIGFGDRSEKIRTYNYINNRITDHRSNITSYRLLEILNGELDILIKNFKV